VSVGESGSISGRDREKASDEHEKWICLAGGTPCLHCGETIVVRDHGALIFHAETGMASCIRSETVATPRKLVEG
jgi:hypothetical protein